MGEVSSSSTHIKDGDDDNLTRSENLLIIEQDRIDLRVQAVYLPRGFLVPWPISESLAE